ncbi:unnamed protein product [Urochloa humidicola]
MGASASRSAAGHSCSHRGDDHRTHLRRVDSNEEATPAATACAMCQLSVDIGTVAYRCPVPGCPFLLHDTCYRRPRKLKPHAGHHEHRLSLIATDQASPSCSICANGFGTLSFAYRCAAARCAAGGFLAHPRCCGLPQGINMVTAEHAHHGRLVLRRPTPTSSGGGDDGPPRRCLVCHRRQRAAAAWSYQCPTPTCDKEVCLACALRSNTTDAEQRCCGVRCCGAVVTPGAVHCLGQAVGVFLCGCVTGMGYPGSAAPTTWTLSGDNGSNKTSV